MTKNILKHTDDWQTAILIVEGKILLNQWAFAIWYTNSPQAFVHPRPVYCRTVFWGAPTRTSRRTDQACNHTCFHMCLSVRVASIDNANGSVPAGALTNHDWGSNVPLMAWRPPITDGFPLPWCPAPRVPPAWCRPCLHCRCILWCWWAVGSFLQKMSRTASEMKPADHQRHGGGQDRLSSTQQQLQPREPGKNMVLENE